MNKIFIKQERALKTFAFEKEETQQSIIIGKEIVLGPELVDLTSLLSEYAPPALNHVSIYDPDNNKFVSLAKTGGPSPTILPLKYFSSDFVMVRFRRI